MIRAAEAFIRQQAADQEIELTLVGPQRRRTIFAGAAPGSPIAISIFSTKRRTSWPARSRQKLIARFVNGEVDAVYILYSRFRSALSQVPTLEKLLPVALTETNEAQAQQQTEYLYEPGVEQLLASLLPRITGVALQRALLEATASEHGARMTAMESATRQRVEDDRRV